MADDNRPILTLTYPSAVRNAELSRFLVGMHDYYTGLDIDIFCVAANFAVDGAPAGTNLVSRFIGKTQGVWELKVKKPVTDLARGKPTVSVRYRQGNVSRIDRTFSVEPPANK
jgi:hypothetical protein